MKLFFCYEKTMLGTWQPVVFHGDVLTKSSNGALPERTKIEEVPDHCISNGESMFGRLQVFFPAPLENEHV